VCTRKGTGVDCADATRCDCGRESVLCVDIVARDEHCRLEPADLLARKSCGERGVEGLEHLARGELGLDDCGSRAARRNNERVEGLEVEWVGDVDHRLAGELLTVGGDDRVDCGVRHRENNDVAGDLSRTGVGLGDVRNVVSASREYATDSAAHVAVSEDCKARHNLAFLAIYYL